MADDYRYQLQLKIWKSWMDCARVKTLEEATFLIEEFCKHNLEMRYVDLMDGENHEK